MALPLHSQQASYTAPLFGTPSQPGHVLVARWSPGRRHTPQASGTALLLATPARAMRQRRARHPRACGRTVAATAAAQLPVRHARFAVQRVGRVEAATRAVRVLQARPGEQRQDACWALQQRAKHAPSCHRGRRSSLGRRLWAGTRPRWSRARRRSGRTRPRTCRTAARHRSRRTWSCRPRTRRTRQAPAPRVSRLPARGARRGDAPQCRCGMQPSRRTQARSS